MAHFLSTARLNTETAVRTTIKVPDVDNGDVATIRLVGYTDRTPADVVALVAKQDPEKGVPCTYPATPLGDKGAKVSVTERLNPVKTAQLLAEYLGVATSKPRPEVARAMANGK